MNERLELLSAMPVFGGLDRATIKLIADLAELVDLKAGEHFFREGDETQAMYVLQSGQVEIYKTWRSMSKVLRRMKAGDCFGEMALIDLCPRSASVVALDRCEALRITPPMLYEIYQHDLEQFTMVQMNMGRELSRRLRRMDDKLFRILMGESLPEATLSDLL